MEGGVIMNEIKKIIIGTFAVTLLLIPTISEAITVECGRTGKAGPDRYDVDDSVSAGPCTESRQDYQCEAVAWYKLKKKHDCDPAICLGRQIAPCPAEPDLSISFGDGDVIILSSEDRKDGTCASWCVVRYPEYDVTCKDCGKKPWDEKCDGDSWPTDSVYSDFYESTTPTITTTTTESTMPTTTTTGSTTTATADGATATTTTGSTATTTTTAP